MFKKGYHQFVKPRFFQRIFNHISIWAAGLSGCKSLDTSEEKAPDYLPSHHDLIMTEKVETKFENPYVDAVGERIWTFFIYVDTAAFANVGHDITGSTPPKDIVRLEKIVTSSTDDFTNDYLRPLDSYPFSITLEVSPGFVMMDSCFDKDFKEATL